MYCPMKQITTTGYHAFRGFGDCEEINCEWWIESKRVCVIFDIASSLKHISESITNKENK